MVRLGYLFALALASILAVGIAIKAWQNRTRTDARALVGVALATAIWTGGTIGLMLATSEVVDRLWIRLMYVGIVGGPIAFFVLALQYTGQDRLLTPWLWRSILLLGAFFLLLAWTNSLHHVYWADVDYAADVPSGAATTPAIGFWGFVAFSYVLLLGGSALFVHYAVTAPNLYRGQTTAILIGVAAPWAANIPHSLQLMEADYTPIALSVTTVALWAAMFRYRLTDVRPIALRTVFDSISTGVFVLDRADRIVDVNAAGKEILDVPGQAIGATFRDVLPSDAFYEPLETPENGPQTVALGANADRPHDEISYFEVQVTPIKEGPHQKVGRLFVIDDVTGRERRRHQLERQNNRLEEFTSVVSHDLRNPLNVASGNVRLASEECDSDFLERADQALSRMASLIDELLVLARGGQTIAEPEPVDLAEVVQDAWDTVNTKQATLVNDAEKRILADRSRLHELIENLIRNAVEHGGENVTVTVGALEDGFYFEDDGQGVPIDERDSIFEAGYSTDETGTGFGLNIVRKISEAHGWTIHLADHDGSGARFAVRNVEGVEE